MKKNYLKPENYFNNEPKITILMPVYNGEKYIYKAIKSILNQTFANFEFLIINDGSTDQSIEIIKSFKDPRIYVVSNNKNLGLINTLNKGLDLARGEYIARMDCDDISLSYRLAKQVEFMDKHHEVGVCGSWIKFIQTGKIFKYPINHDQIKALMFINNGLAHPTAMMRTSVLRKNKLYYNSSYKHVEDYDLWVRISKISCLANIPEVLLRYRLHEKQISQEYSVEQKSNLKVILIKQLKTLTLDFKKKELQLHISILSNEKVNRFKAKNWIKKLKLTNSKTKIYAQKPFDKILKNLWFNITLKSFRIYLNDIKTLIRMFFIKHSKKSLKKKIKLTIVFINKYIKKILKLFKMDKKVRGNKNEKD